MQNTLHPRLSLSAITAPARAFPEDLDFCARAGLRCVGLFDPKLAGFGHDRATDAILRHGLAVSSIIAGGFTLLDSARWPEERARINRCISLAAVVGGAVYGPTGRGAIDDWDGNAARYAEAVAPCVAHAGALGVTLAFEPSLRPHLSFAHTLRDAIELAERSAVGVVVDVGNCCTERDARGWIGRIGKDIAVLQVSDVAIGTMDQPGAGVRTLPGEGELPLGSFIAAACDAGYAGPVEIEFLGPKVVDEAAVMKSLHTMDEILVAVAG